MLGSVRCCCAAQSSPFRPLPNTPCAPFSGCSPPSSTPKNAAIPLFTGFSAIYNNVYFKKVGVVEGGAIAQNRGSNRKNAYFYPLSIHPLISTFCNPLSPSSVTPFCNPNCNPNSKITTKTAFFRPSCKPRKRRHQPQPMPQFPSSSNAFSNAFSTPFNPHSFPLPLS